MTALSVAFILILFFGGLFIPSAAEAQEAAKAARIGILTINLAANPT